MAIQFEIHRLDSNQTMIAEFESLADAETWLRERPRDVTVVRVPGIDEATSQRLRGLMRPLDAEEKAKIAALEVAAAERQAAEIEREQQAALEDLAARREAAKDLDPDRAMVVNWTIGEGCEVADPADPRELPKVVVEAVEAWVAERNTWVHRRGLHVVSADVIAWPGPIPAGSDDARIQPGGQFNTLAGDPTDPD